VTVPQPASSTVVVSSRNPSSVGELVTFTATVAPVLATATPGGTVTFFANGALAGSAALDPAGVATFSTSSLAAGTTTVRADYGGDAVFLPSSGAVDQTVARTPTTTIVVSSANPSVVGQNVTFTATVGPSTATGTVAFSVDGAVAGSAPIVGGQATFSTSAMAVGAHPVVAIYSGDAVYLGSASATLTQTVGPQLRQTSTVVTSNRVPSASLGQRVTFTATVRPLTGTGTPTGTVQFSIDGAAVSGVLPLNAQGTASYSTATLAAGNHNVIATYGGSAIFAGSSSATFVQAVARAASTTTLTSSRNPSVSGQSVTFTARVTPVAAVGAVTFRVDGVAFGGLVPLDATGRARLVTSALAVGTHAVSVVYGGSSNYLPSTSGVVTQRVTKGASRTVVATSRAGATRGTTVVFTATVTAVAPATGVPTGTVRFRIDGVAVGSPVTLNASGQAAYATRTLTPGRHTVTAVYAGDGAFNASTSAAIMQLIR
jgi:hypothetical protein